MDDESRDQAWADHQAVTELLYRYSDIVTRAAWDEDAALFVDDAVVEIATPFDARIVGAEAIRRWRAGTEPFELLIHTTFSPSIRIVGDDRAYATSQTHEIVRGPAVGDSTDGGAEQMNVAFRSIYYDDIVKVDGAWRFAHRRCRPIYLESGAVTGTSFATRSSLPQFPR